MTKLSIFDAISDLTRRQLLDILAKTGSRKAGDLARLFPDISRPAVSKHLRILRQTGLVKQISKGRERWYKLNAEPLAQVNDWISQYKIFWN